MSEKIQKESYFKNATKKLLRNKLATIALLVLILELVLIIGAPVFTQYEPAKQSLQERLLPPSFSEQQLVDYEGVAIKDEEGNFKYSKFHLLGTDNFGRDILTRILYGGRISLTVGLVAILFGMTVGVVAGLFSAYYPKVDAVVMRIMDIMFSFPGILLAMLIVAMLGTSLVNVTLAISIWSIPTFARIVRGEALSVKQNDYIKAIKSVGAGDLRIIFIHILPNCIAPIVVYSTMRMATAILSIASLSYLGIGAQPPLSEWGTMVAAGRDYMYDSPHMIIVPGVAIIITMLCFNILGDVLRDILDPNLSDNF
jgi:peptide/nickel transport system permease protein